MSEHFNNLTPAQAERLALLAEELGETIQVIGKILRHGYESTHPNGGPTNRQLLEKELGDVKSACWFMQASYDITSDEIVRHAHEKSERVLQYFHHQGE